MFERPLLYLVPPYAAMLLIAVRFGLVPSPFLCLPALAVLLIGAAFAVRHRRAFTVLAMLSPQSLHSYSCRSATGILHSPSAS